MRVLLQRVIRAEVRVEGEVVGSVGPGLLLLVGFSGDDGEPEMTWMAKKCAGLRVFSDEQGKMNRSVVDIDGEVLVVSQFTLYADADKGNRPGFVRAAAPSVAVPLYTRFVELVGHAVGRPAKTGRFGAHMEVESVNDGPVTLWLERARRGN